VNVPAVAVKFADVAPDATVTDPGTDRALVLLERAIVAPPAGAASFSAAAQVDEPPLVRDAKLQDSPVSTGDGGGAGTVIVPPVPVTEIGPPPGAAPAKLVIPTGVVIAELVIVTLITATTPFWMTASLIPVSRHV